MNTGHELAHLSLQRVGHRATPRVRTNEERIKAYRAFMPVQFANTRFLSPAERYAQAESIDNSLPSDDGYREIE